MVPSYLIPRTPDQLAAFAQSERYLLTTMVIIASRHDTSKSMRKVHDQSWAVMRVSTTTLQEDSMLMLRAGWPISTVWVRHQPSAWWNRYSCLPRTCLEIRSELVSRNMSRMTRGHWALERSFTRPKIGRHGC
jgi:hypothetical protein